MSEMLDKLSETVGALCEEYGRQLLELRQERDQLRAELAAAKNLLARIHRDGGHHTEAVGFIRSAQDAEKKVLGWLSGEIENDRQT